MGAPLSEAVRHKIIAHRQSGMTYDAIAKELGVSYGAVYKLCKRFRLEGDVGLLPKYFNCGKSGPGRDCLIFRAACWLRRLHPDWGAEFIHAILKDRYPSESLPVPRTFRKWFKAHGLDRPRAKAELPPTPGKWAGEAHEVWQVDAKEGYRIESEQRVCWLSIVDEKSGALLEAPPFPQKQDLPG